MFGTLLLVVLISVITYLLIRKPRRFPPGPLRVPFLGYVPWINEKHTYKTWAKLRSIYGDIFGIFIGMRPLVVVNGWEAIKEGLLNDALNFRPFNLFFSDVNNGKTKGVLFVDGEFWKTQRRFSLFHLRNLGFGKKSHESVIHDELMEVISEFKSQKEPFVVSVPLAVSNINVLWSILGGERLSRTDGKLSHLVVLIDKSFKAAEGTGGLISSLPFLRYIFPALSNYKTRVSGLKEVYDFIRDQIREHQKNIDPENPRDLIDIYLKEMGKENCDPSFTEDQLMALILDVFVAGTETTSSLVSFAIMYLCLFPEKQKVLQKELDEVVGHVRMPSMADKSKLIQMDAFLTETMRTRPPVPNGVAHRAIEDTNLQGTLVPKGSMIFFNLRSVLMDEKYWGDPEAFRPERFIENGTLKIPERFIPFGKGRRICLGESLARMNSFLTFSSLVQHFTFSLPPGEVIDCTEGTTGASLTPPIFKVIASPRIH